MSTQAISKFTGWDRKTVRKYLLQPSALLRYRPRPKQASKLDSVQAVSGRAHRRVWNAQVLLRELRACHYTSGYTILKDWLQPPRSSARVVAVRRFETPRASRPKWTGPSGNFGE